MTAGKYACYGEDASVDSLRQEGDMNGFFKWLGIGFGGLVGLLATFGLVTVISTESRINKVYDIPMEDISSTEADVDRGAHLVSIYCVDCHGRDLGGTEFINEMPLAIIPATNLTSGEGGAGQTFSDADFERALRHGVGSDGRGLWIMPSNEFNHFSDDDVAAIIAYLRSIEPVNSTWDEPQAGPLGRILVTLGAVPLLAVENIAHNEPHVASMEPAVTADYGEYLAIPCTGCHQHDFGGGPMPGEPPDSLPAANLTPAGSGLGGWSEEDFLRSMQQGIRPDGSAIDPSMPWPQFSATMTEDELRAIWLYLESLPPVATES